MDIALIIELTLFVILMLLSGFFSSSETSLFSLNKLQLEQMRRDDNDRIDLSDLSEELDIELPKGRYSSLAGFILEKAGEIPSVGSSIEYKKLKFTIVQGSAQSIQEVKIS